MTTVLIVSGLMFGFAGIAATIRIVRGPTNIDRIVGADVLTATLMCWLGVWMIANRSALLMPALLALAMFALVGTVSVSRFLSREEENS
ncbi:MAG: monovalent cation/H+ antiporter complex subunit F [Demequina sp.]